MSLQIESAFCVPKETARIAHAVFPQGNVYLTRRDQLGTLFADEQFEDLFAPQGQPARALNVLRLVVWLGEVPRAKTRTSPLAGFCTQMAASAAAVRIIRQRHHTLAPF